MIAYTTQEVQAYDLSNEGALFAEQGSHEARVWNALPLKGEGAGLSAAELKTAVGDESAKHGQALAFKNRWIGKEGDKFFKLVSSWSWVLIRYLLIAPTFGSLLGCHYS